MQFCRAGIMWVILQIMGPFWLSYQNGALILGTNYPYGDFEGMIGPFSQFGRPLGPAQEWVTMTGLLSRNVP